jgi:FkbM family methyltransferase
MTVDYLKDEQWSRSDRASKSDIRVARVNSKHMNVATRTRQLLERGGPLAVCKGALRFLYWHSGLRNARYALGYRLFGTPVSSTVEGVTATFDVSTPQEYARNTTLHGERPVIADLLRTLGEDDVLYDIGANVGTYTCFAGQRLESGRVVAFEPHPSNVRRLRDNADRNGVEADVRSVALSNTQGTDHLDLSGDNGAAGGGTHSLTTDGNQGTIEVEVIEGDRLVDDGEVPPPSVLKIDVEGAEQLVLEGLSDTLENGGCHTIYCEVHPARISEFGGSVEALRGLLESSGYSLQRIADRSPEYFLKATLTAE